MPVNDQEKLIGPLITQVTNRLPAEKRKGYLLRPQSFLTYQSLLERILNADGITTEMIQAQQKRISIVERLLGASTPEARMEIIKQETRLTPNLPSSVNARALVGQRKASVAMTGEAASGETEYA
jgi:hypothetical protein